MISRGKGWIAPLLFVGSVVCMIPSRELGVPTCHAIMLVWLLLSGAWVAWYGARSLRRAADQLGRPLAKHELVLDLRFTESMPFDSFMFIQMPWWAIAFAVVSFKIARMS